MTYNELRSEVQRRIEWSAEYIRRAEPIVWTLLGDGKILRVEGKEDEVCKALDRTCGTDYLYMYPTRNHAWGIACRVQRYDKANFTVRASIESGKATELDKRRYAINHNGIYPYLTMQMFVDDDKKAIRRLGIARTVDIIDAVDNGMYTQGKVYRDDRGGQNTFFAVEWDEMQRAGYRVLVYDATA